MLSLSGPAAFASHSGGTISWPGKGYMVAHWRGPRVETTGVQLGSAGAEQLFTDTKPRAVSAVTWCSPSNIFTNLSSFLTFRCLGFTF